MTTCGVHMVLMVIGYLSYLLMGAAIFQALEEQSERKVKREMVDQKRLFLENHSCLSEEAMRNFLQMMMKAQQNGVNLLEMESLNQTNWDFSGSFFFVGTVITTIGYGYLAPRTAGGQIFCVLFAMFGIPLNLIVLSRVGKRLSSCTERLDKLLYKRGIEKKLVKIVTMVFFLMMGIFLFLAIPPLVFHSIEGWSYREGVYYAFITLSTIGFGDYVVGVKSGKPYYRFLVALWILFGMAWLAFLFNLLTNFYTDTEKKITKVHQKRKAAKAVKDIGNGTPPVSPISEETVALEMNCSTMVLLSEQDSLAPSM
ncbi:potassium channel subfamily K member 16-like [Erpetoichthys calabaricus]|uniref:Potassium channel subfamily K member n=1 Tax=Erpetoichthys calabaricus TaxID=27687 RepID=A0A8C4SUN2_ERPCA|nr:potassium channel subfamily K member 16-like [Erpetoichthys calabaricus]